MRILIGIVLLLITTSSLATTFEGGFIQGSFILGKTEPGSEVFIDKKKIKVTPDGYFVFGLSRDRKYDVVITLSKDGNKQKIVKKVQKRKYYIFSYIFFLQFFFYLLLLPHHFFYLELAQKQKNHLE